MSPTLLELVVVLLVLGLAWLTASWFGPYVIASFLSYWRKPRPSDDPAHWPGEKNVAPPGTPDTKPPVK